MHSIHFLLLFTHISTILLYYVPPHFRRQANITILELPLTPLYVYNSVTAHLIHVVKYATLIQYTLFPAQTLSDLGELTLYPT